MACKLFPKLRDFEAVTGVPVTLVTKNPDKVLIKTAEYAGRQLVPNGDAVSSLELTILPGPNELSMVFVFQPGIATGELHEDCGGDSHLLRSLSHGEPFKSFTIVGKSSR